MNRRLFLQRVPLTAAGLVIAGNVAMFEGCAAGDTVINILNLLTPAVNGILPIVALVDPAIGPAVTAAITIFDGGVTTVTNLYHDYEAAAAANGGTAPTLKQEFLAALQALTADVKAVLAAAQVKDPAHATLIQAIVSAVAQEIATIIGFFTPAAASARITVTTLPSTSSLKNEQKAFKAHMYAVLTRPTGDAQLDATAGTLAKSYK